MIPEGVLSPFLYLLDIVKDSMWLVFIIYAVHGFQFVFEYWSSFSSVVSTETKQNTFSAFFLQLQLRMPSSEDN